MQLTGTFQIIDWKESIEKTFTEGGKLTTAKVNQQYSGDVIGNSEITFQMHYSSNGDAIFIGFEYIEGNLAGLPCQLTIKHDGTFKAGIATSTFAIVYSSTHQALTNAKGSFTSTEDGQANYFISNFNTG